MLYQLNVQSFVANINRGTLAIKQLTNRVLQKYVPFALTHAFSRLRKPMIVLRIVSSGSLSQIICKTIFILEVFCGFEL